MEKVKGKKKQAKNLPNTIASKLAALSKKWFVLLLYCGYSLATYCICRELTELIRDGLLLVPSSSYFTTAGRLFLFELEGEV